MPATLPHLVMKTDTVKRAGVIDIGSHSIKLIIGETAGTEIKVLESLKNVIPIGRDTFFKERITQETINQAVTVLAKYSQVLKEYEVKDVSVIATTAVREARNRDVFRDTIARKTGFSIDVLTVGDVIYYIDAYLYHRLKDTYPIHEKNLLIAELGSGSLDVSFMARGFTLMNMGLPLGTLRLKQLISKLDGSLSETAEALVEYIENEFAYLKRSLPNIAVDDVILIDENYSYYLEQLLPERKHDKKFFTLELAESQELLAAVSDKTAEEISRTYKIPLETADTIAAYAVIVSSFYRLTESKAIYVFEALLSEAILSNTLLDYELSTRYNKTNQLVSIADFLCRKYNVDVLHVRHVATLAEALFDGLKEQLGLKKTDFLYLLLASYLHDIGMYIYNRGHHKHSEYIINSLDLFRLTDEEIKIIAAIARYHRKAPPISSHLVYASLPVERQILVQKLAALLRIANALDRSHKQKAKKIDLKFTKSQDVTLTATVEGNFLLERSDFMEKKELFEELTGNTISLKIQRA